MANEDVNGSAQGADEEEVYAEAGGTRIPPHPAGPHQMVVCDVRNLGMLETTYKGKPAGKKPHVLVSFQSTELIHVEKDDPSEQDHPMEGKRYVIHRRYTNSLADSANLRQHAEAILKRPLTKDELKPKGFSLAHLIGHNCQCEVVHTDKGAITYANVKNVSGWNTKFGADIRVEDYIRWKDRPKDENGNVIRDSERTTDSPVVMKLELQQKLKTIVAQAETYNIKPKSPIDYTALSVQQLEKLCTQWQNAVNAEAEKRRLAAENEPDEFDDVPGDENDSGSPVTSEEENLGPVTEDDAVSAEPDFDGPGPDTVSATGTGDMITDAQRRAILALAKRALNNSDIEAGILEFAGKSLDHHTRDEASGLIDLLRQKLVEVQTAPKATTAKSTTPESGPVNAAKPDAAAKEQPVKQDAILPATQKELTKAAKTAAKGDGKTAIAQKMDDAKVDDDPEGSASFNQKTADIIAAKWRKDTEEELAPHHLKVIDSAEDAELEIPDDFVTNGRIMGVISDYLESKGKSRIPRLTDLKTAQAALACQGIANAEIIW